MKTKTYKNRDFSSQFDHLTLHDIVSKKNHKKELTVRPNLSLFPMTKEKPFWSLDENFHERRMAQDLIIPNRFVWHVSYELNTALTNFSIAKDGLLVSKGRYNAVFANNNLFYTGCFYPFCAFEGDMFDSTFWRIDTYAFKAEWRIDPNMLEECDDLSPSNFICTTNNIPPFALKAFRMLELDYYLQPPSARNRGDLRTPIYLLSPDPKVNFWLSKLHKKVA